MKTEFFSADPGETPVSSNAQKQICPVTSPRSEENTQDCLWARALCVCACVYVAIYSYAL